MKSKSIIISLVGIVLVAALFFVLQTKHGRNDKNIISFIVDPTKQNLQFYWKNDINNNFGSIENFRLWLKKDKKNLVFATNGGMYNQNNSPQGLYIENNKILSSLDTLSGNGNFYLKPNGIFYITQNKFPIICNTNNFTNDGNIKFATQSGPMLVIDGKIHPAFIKGSTSVNIRNGVGILPDNSILFAMSKKEISFYDFANYFKKLGCKNALYLDGYVSRTYLPEKKWVQTDGNFGVIIAVCDK